MLVGLRGVGKTVLLNKVEEMAEQNGYIATRFTPSSISLIRW
jgi:nucleoside-triphosphatase THEP1